MIVGLDHVALVVRDLDAAIDGYVRLLGVTPEWIGRGGGVRQAWSHPEHGPGPHCAGG